MSAKRDPNAKPPSGLVAQTFEAGGEEFVLFSWGAPERKRSVTAKITSLSAAEQEVLAAVVRGASNRGIAAERGVSERTIANQVASILRKLGARSRFELIRRHSDA